MVSTPSLTQNRFSRSWHELPILILVVLAFLFCVPGAPFARAEETADTSTVSFIRDVAPVLVKRCVSCHSDKKAESNYRLDTFEALGKPGDFEMNPVTAGDIDDSEILRLITSSDPDERMPRGSEALSEKEIALIKLWIEQGATFDGEKVDRLLSEIIPRPTHATPPEVYPISMPITSLLFHSVQNELIVSGHHELTIWNLETGELLRRIGGFAERTHALALSPDGTALAVAGGSPGQHGEVRVINPNDGTELKWFGAFGGILFDAAFSPDGTKLATAGEDRTVRVFELATGEQIQSIENHSDWVTAVTWSPDSTLLASGSRDRNAKVFELESGQLRTSYSGHGNPVFGIIFHPDGKQLLSAGGDNKVHVWNLEDAKKTAEIAGYSGSVFKLLLSNGQIFTASADKSAKQHQLDNREQKHVFGDHSDWVYSLAVDSENQRLATGCYDGQVRIWNLADGSATLTFTAAPGTTSPPVKH